MYGGETKMGVSYTKLASVVAVAAVVGAVIFHQPVNAAPDTFTWTGAAGDHKMSTAGNWEEGSVPTAGSKLVFKCVVGGQENIQNDLTVALSGLETKKGNLPAGRSCASYHIDKMQFTPDAEFTGGRTTNNDRDNRKIPLVHIDTVTGLSNLKSNGFDGEFKNKPTINRLEVTNVGCNKITEDIKAAEKIVGENASVSLDGANNILVKNKGRLRINGGFFENNGYYTNVNETSASKITFENGAMISRGILGCSVDSINDVSPDLTTVLSGDIVLNGDVEYKLDPNITLKITGKLSGPGKLIAHRDNEGSVLVESSNNTSGTPNGRYGSTHEPKLIKLDGDTREVVTVKKGETALLNGHRQEVAVSEGGVLNGDGIIDNIYSYGVVSPGNNSIGKITTGGSFAIYNNGVYKVKILDKDHYDQMDVGYFGVIGDGRLDLTLLEGGVVKEGDTFTIVNHTEPVPVQGTFKDLPEGAEITVSGVTFKISYVGGDGNDVVLTALKVSKASEASKAPKVPNTGGEKLAVNLIGAIAGVASAAALLIVAKRKSFNKK